MADWWAYRPPASGGKSPFDTPKPKAAPKEKAKAKPKQNWYRPLPANVREWSNKRPKQTTTGFYQEPVQQNSWTEPDNSKAMAEKRKKEAADAKRPKLLNMGWGGMWGAPGGPMEGNAPHSSVDDPAFHVVPVRSPYLTPTNAVAASPNGDKQTKVAPTKRLVDYGWEGFMGAPGGPMESRHPHSSAEAPMALQDKRHAKFKEPKGKRELTKKEYDKLSDDQQNMVRFTTLFNKFREAGDDKGMMDIYAKMTYNRPDFRQVVNRDQFKQGMAGITLDDLLGVGKTKVESKKASDPYFDTQWGQHVGPRVGPKGKPMIAPNNITGSGDNWAAREKQEYQQQFKGEARKRTLAALVDNVSEFMRTYDAEEKVKQAAAAAAAAKQAKIGRPDAATGAATADAVSKALGGAPAGAPSMTEDQLKVQLSNNLKIPEEGIKLLDQFVDELTKKSMWSDKKASADNVWRSLDSYKIPRDVFTEYATQLLQYRQDNKQPLSGNAKDTIDMDTFVTNLKLKKVS